MTPDEAARDVYVFLMQGETCKAHAPSYNCGICRNQIASALARAHAEGKAEGRRERDAEWRRYARHMPTCKVRLAADLRTGALDVVPCTCGLSELLGRDPAMCVCGFPRSEHVPSRGCVELFLYGPTAPRSLIPAAPQPEGHEAAAHKEK